MIHIKIDNYNYELPAERIAQYPLEERDNSRLLVSRGENISDDKFRSLPAYLPAGSLLVFNDTRVIRARLLFTKNSGAAIEIFCLGPLLPSDYSLSFSSKRPVEWKCLVGNLKKWKDGRLSCDFSIRGRQYELTAERTGESDEATVIKFSWNSTDITFGEVIEATGHVPLPPYIKRDDDEKDISRYQTVYSMVKGSVAAPTAGLHFTKKVFENLEQKGITWTNVTLHVGAGTFQPVKSDDIAKHEMHTEHFFVTKGAIETIYKNLDNIIAVGTTSVRTIESLYWLGVKISMKPDIEPENLFIDQWDPYRLQGKITAGEALESVMNWMKKLNKRDIHIPTRVIIVPGYKFRLTGGIITNFHQPRSTLLLLVSAWTGENWKRIYEYALGNGFRFLSYGDSSLLLKR